MIEIKNITKEFKISNRKSGLKGSIEALFSSKFTVVKAVDDISFSINEGEIVGYIGANGAGKSTTIKMMTGILTPTKGECKVNGIIPYKKRKDNARNIGVVFGQRTQLWWDLPLEETFAILKEIYNIEDKEFNTRMVFLDEVLGLNAFIKSPVRTLSLGQRMRADLAASLIHNPKVLYLDEPTIGLDVVAKEKIRNFIKEINREYKTTVILTTHDLDDIEELCNRVIIIDKGKKIYDGGVDQIKNAYGYMRKITFELKDKLDVSVQKINEKIQVGAEGTILIEGNSLEISFNKNEIKVSDLIATIMSRYNVIDIKINETSIEEIIKKIYRYEVEV